MPCDAPCVVELSPPQRGMAQTQPLLVGTDAQSLPALSLMRVWGPGGISRVAAPLRRSWSTLGRGFASRDRHTQLASPVSGSNRAGPGRALCALLDLPKWSDCVSLCPSVTGAEKATARRNAPSTSSPKHRSKRAGSSPQPPPGLWYLAAAPSVPAPAAFAYVSSVPVMPYPPTTV